MLSVNVKFGLTTEQCEGGSHAKISDRSIPSIQNIKFMAADKTYLACLIGRKKGQCVYVYWETKESVGRSTTERQGPENVGLGDQ